MPAVRNQLEQLQLSARISAETRTERGRGVGGGKEVSQSKQWVVGDAGVGGGDDAEGAAGGGARVAPQGW